jgi:ribosome maturation factor RimP
MSLADGKVDEEVAMPGGIRPAAGPVDDKRLAGLIQPVATAAGMDVESVRVSVVGKRRLLRVVVDSDRGVSLDDAAEVSRQISALLDASNTMGEIPYTLEVSSPGVDRPLTEPRHWRRAARRLVKVKVSGEGSLVGRVLAADDSGVTLDVDGSKRELGYGALGPGAIQVEFGRLPDADELADADEVAGSDDDLDDELAADEHGDDELDEFGDDELDEFGDELNEEELDDELEDEAELGAGGDGH